MQVPGIAIRHEAAWELDIDPERKHLAYFRNHAILKVFGRFVQRTRASALITFYGPAGVVTFRFTIPDLGEIVMFQTHLPLGPLEQKVDFHWFAAAKIPRMLVSYVIGNWVSQWQNDVAIWENKIHRPRPVLVQETGRSTARAGGSRSSTPDGSGAKWTTQVEAAAEPVLVGQDRGVMRCGR